MIQIQINGEHKNIQDNLTIGKLLEDLSINRFTVAVERNETVVRRIELDTTQIQAGDIIEIVRILGGG